MVDVIKRTTLNAKEQRQVIACLEGEDEDSAHVYAITKTWYEQWRCYVGLSGEEECGKDGSRLVPGALDMDGDTEDNNMYVDEKIWCKWVEWYGVAGSHHLDRRNCASDEKEFEVCILSTYSGILQNPLKTFDISEETGYIELQLRRIFGVGEHRMTRLWACERARHARFTQLLNRSKEICHQHNIDMKKSYILALEVADLNNTWPSHNPGDPRGSLDKYAALSGRVREAGYWEAELTHTLDKVFGGITHELNETVSGIVTTTKCVTAQKEKDLSHLRDKLEVRARGVEEVQKTLNKKAKDILQEEELSKMEARRLRRDRDNLEQERLKFHEEIRKMEELNEIHEARVKLNIGGTAYMTSTLTLLKDPSSMLAAMFSGRHSLRREEDGSYFIDRDGTHFRFVLNYLRDGGFRDGTLPTNKTFLNELLTEAEFYQISSLVKLLRDFLKGGNTGAVVGEESDNEGSPRPERKHHNKRAHRKVAVIK